MWKLKNRFMASLFAVFILIACSGIGTAAEIVVHNGGSIQAAIDNATEGDTIIVESGTYNENFTITKHDLTIKSKSGSSNTIINGDVSVSDEYSYSVSATIDGFTFNGDYGNICIFTGGGFTGCTVKNSKIARYNTGMFAHTDGSVHAINTQFIECEVGMASGWLTSVIAENCKFIDCGVAMSPGGGPDGYYYSKNNVEIHTDSSGKQTTTPIPNTDPVAPTIPQPIANNTSNDPSENDSSDHDSDSSSDSSSDNEHHSSGGSSHKSSGGGGTGGSPEAQKNVANKDTTQVFIASGKNVIFNFKNNVTVVNSISFESKKTMGKTTAITEDLKNKSSLVSELPEGIVYKSFNIWVGNAGYGESDNVMNATMNFSVGKSWVTNNSINVSSISLYKYDDEKKEWMKLPVNLANEDDQSLHFTAKVPGYSSFVITGQKGKQSTLAAEPVATVKSGNIKDSASTIAAKATEGNEKAPGFGIINGVVCLFCIFLYRIKEK